jgi:hypothetical protein
MEKRVTITARLSLAIVNNSEYSLKGYNIIKNQGDIGISAPI